MLTYKIVALTDVSQPQLQNQQPNNQGTSSSRVIDTVKEDDDEGYNANKQRCLKFILAPINAEGSLRVAFEQEPLSYTQAQLLGSHIQLINPEERHDVFCLTPGNARIVSVADGKKVEEYNHIEIYDDTFLVSDGILDDGELDQIMIL